MNSYLMSYTLGLSYGFHDSAIALIDKNGKPVFAAQEERYSRIKNDSSFPSRAISAAVEHLGISLNDIKKAGFYEQPISKIARIVKYSKSTSHTIIQRRLSRDPFFNNPRLLLESLLPNCKSVICYPHHLSHAGSVLISSNKKSIAVVIDGVGEFDSTSIWKSENQSINRIGHTEIPDSLGLLYAAITSYLDFEVNEGEYKVMGLASYGEPKYLSLLLSQVTLHDNLSYPFTISKEYFDLTGSTTNLYKDSLNKLLGLVPLDLGDKDLDSLPKIEFQKYSDLAASIQCVAEIIIDHIFNLVCNKYPDYQLLYSGGVALNCKANSKILSKYGDIIFQPACGDAGGSLGAAYLAHTNYAWSQDTESFISENKSNSAIPSSDLLYMGTCIKRNGLEERLRKYGANNLTLFKSNDDMYISVAKGIIEGEIIGWVQGQIEWGPRALGARSILASPNGRETQDRINHAVKFRERFRPFAPILLTSYYESFVNQNEDHRKHLAYNMMLSTVQVSKEAVNSYPACVHIDETARIQLIPDDSGHPICQLLKVLTKFGHPPILVNTSFNLKGEPIVCTEMDAINTFWHTALDCLYIENIRVDRIHR